MPNIALTGSETLRFEEIQQRWIVFEPVSYSEYPTYRLYTVPLGQTVEPEFILNSGSYTTSDGAIEIEKITHQFDDETEASKFLTEIGIDNVISYKEKVEESDVYETSRLIEIQVVNFPSLNFAMSFLDKEIEKGFILEVFKSGSIESGGIRKVTDKIVKDKRGRIVSDTYLKYFQIVSDNNARS